MLQEALGALGHTRELRRISAEEEARGLTLSDGELFSADGLIVLGGLACERIEDLQALGLPLLLPDCLPTAYLCVCDKTAYRLVNVLTAAGIRVPEQVAVVTFDDSTYSRRCSPRLTTISVEKDQLINRCITLLLKKIRTDGYREHVFLSGQIRVRESC
ncbi:substrate-binding domain-containing protein [Fournierella sp.]|uniref:substrate-binding domain-containing protein n=1 Tax=Allofournierella sp. TaxID=1940256 RepID=UPI003079E56A